MMTAYYGLQALGDSQNKRREETRNEEDNAAPRKRIFFFLFSLPVWPEKEEEEELVLRSARPSNSCNKGRRFLRFVTGFNALRSQEQERLLRQINR